MDFVQPTFSRPNDSYVTEKCVVDEPKLSRQLSSTYEKYNPQSELKFWYVFVSTSTYNGSFRVACQEKSTNCSIFFSSRYCACRWFCRTRQASILPNVTGFFANVSFNPGDLVCSNQNLALFQENSRSLWASLAHAATNYVMQGCSQEKNTNILLYGIVGSEVILAQENGAYTEIDLKPLQVQQVSIVALRNYPLRILSREKIIVIIDDGKILSVVPEVSTSTLHGITNEQSSRFFHLLYNPLQNSEKVCSNVNSFVRCDTRPSSASASAHACFNSTPLYFRPLVYRSKHFVIPFVSSELSIISDAETTCVVRQGDITHISFETEHKLNGNKTTPTCH